MQDSLDALDQLAPLRWSWLEAVVWWHGVLEEHVSNIEPLRLRCLHIGGGSGAHQGDIALGAAAAVAAAAVSSDQGA